MRTLILFATLALAPLSLPSLALAQGGPEVDAASAAHEHMHAAASTEPKATPVLAATKASPSIAPMIGAADGLWANIHLQYRARPELRDNADLDASAADTLAFGLQRARLGATLGYGTWLKALVQVQDARRAGFGNSTAANNGNTDLHQAWVQMNLLDKALSLKIGRQQLSYGDQRLVGAFEWSNTGRVFEAAKLRWNHGLGWLDFFTSVTTPMTNGNMLDATHFLGVYDSLKMGTLGLDIVWEQYLLGLVDTGRALPAGAAYDPEADPQPDVLSRQFVTAGTRLVIKGYGFKAGFEGAYQYGALNAAKGIGQNAFALHADLRYNIPVVTSPYIGIESNVSTGDDASTPRQSERFVNLFPTNHLHYGFMDLQNWSNAVNANLTAGLSLGKTLKLRADYWLHMRGDVSDGWTNAGGETLVAAPDPSAPGAYDNDPLLGHEVDGTVKWLLHPKLKILGGLGVFVPAGFALTRGSDPQLWTWMMLVAGF